MKFTLSTKPLVDALNLGVIPANVSKFYKLSYYAQVTVTKQDLRINLQADGVKTEMYLRGTGDSDGEETAFVDCLVFKQLIGTLESNTVTIEISDNTLTVHSGSSKFSVPCLDSAEGSSMERPKLATPDCPKIQVNISDWKFIKDYQLYAVSSSFAKPIYTKVWVGESGDVVAGSYATSFFTFSKKNKLGKTCVLKGSIVNLFNSLPEGATITLIDDSYRIDVKTDSFEYAAEVCPEYEDDGKGKVGQYKAEQIMEQADVKDYDNSFKVAVAPIAKFLSQSDLLSPNCTGITFEIKDSVLNLKDDNVDCKIKIEGRCTDFSINLSADLFKSIMSHVDQDTIRICPAISADDDGEIAGLVIWTDNIDVAIGGLEEEGEN